MHASGAMFTKRERPRENEYETLPPHPITWSVANPSNRVRSKKKVEDVVVHNGNTMRGETIVSRSPRVIPEIPRAAETDRLRPGKKE